MYHIHTSSAVDAYHTSWDTTTHHALYMYYLGIYHTAVRQDIFSAFTLTGRKGIPEVLFDTGVHRITASAHRDLVGLHETYTYAKSENENEDMRDTDRCR